jgi:hypothetical protein
MSAFATHITKAVLSCISDDQATDQEYQDLVDSIVPTVQDILTHRDGGVKEFGVRYMDLEEFGREGYLQEVNRQFFHPHGLALEITCDLSEGNDAYSNAVITGIWDYRDDPEGIIFGGSKDPEYREEKKQKAENVRQERVKHFRTRAILFGVREKNFNLSPEGYDFTSAFDIEPLVGDWAEGEE